MSLRELKGDHSQYSRSYRYQGQARVITYNGFFFVGLNLSPIPKLNIYFEIELLVHARAACVGVTDDVSIQHLLLLRWWRPDILDLARRID